MATKIDPVPGVTYELSPKEVALVKTGLQMALASKKRAMSAPTTSDEMRAVYTRELSEMTALYMRFVP